MLLDFSKAEYENIEAVALAYIYAVILVVFLFKSHDLATIDEIEQTSHVHNQGDRDGVQFLFKEWLEQMQNDLNSVGRETSAWFALFNDAFF